MTMKIEQIKCKHPDIEATGCSADRSSGRHLVCCMSCDLPIGEVLEHYRSIISQMQKAPAKPGKDGEGDEGPLKFASKGDFWGWRWIGHCWLIESKDEDMLIGDGLPSDEATAKLLARCANRARDEAFDEFKESFVADVQAVVLKHKHKD